MNKDDTKLELTRKSVINNLKNLSLDKKDRTLLLSLIELFDWLTPNEEDRFLPKLERMASQKNIQEEEEFKIRMYSLQTQLNNNKNIKITRYPAFSMYYQSDKVEIYIKKLSTSWNNLIEEIKKEEFDHILINVFKSSAKKEKILSTKLKKIEAWEPKLVQILDANIHTNIRITLVYPKQKL